MTKISFLIYIPGRKENIGGQVVLHKLVKILADMGEDYDKLKSEIEYLLLSNSNCKEYIIKLSDNINKDYFSYPLLVKKVRDVENFTMVRYQDGEWTCMLKIEPHFTNKIPKYGIEIDKLGDEMLRIIESKPEYYISVNAGTFYERAGIVWPYIKDLKRLYVEKFYNQYKDKITQIDMGAIWDPYCGKKTRPYHEKVLERLKN